MKKQRPNISIVSVSKNRNDLDKKIPFNKTYIARYMAEFNILFVKGYFYKVNNN